MISRKKHARPTLCISLGVGLFSCGSLGYSSPASRMPQTDSSVATQAPSTSPSPNRKPDDATVVPAHTPKGIVMPAVEFRDADIFFSLVFLIHKVNGIPDWIEPVQVPSSFALTLDDQPEPSSEQLRKMQANKLKKKQHYPLLLLRCNEQRITFSALQVSVLDVASILAERVELQAVQRDGKLLILDRDGSVLAK